jgi:7-keto-8-aminopelargonate synthetase-like enzyme
MHGPSRKSVPSTAAAGKACGSVEGLCCGKRTLCESLSDSDGEPVMAEVASEAPTATDGIIVVVEGTGAVDKETDEGEVAELLDATLQDVNKSTRHIYM